MCQAFEDAVIGGDELGILVLADLQRDIAGEGGDHPVELFRREVLDGLIQEIIRHLAHDLLIQLLAKKPLELLSKDIAEREPLHGGELGSGLLGDLSLLVTG